MHDNDCWLSAEKDKLENVVICFSEHVKVCIIIDSSAHIAIRLVSMQTKYL